MVKESIERLIDNYHQKRRSKQRLYWDYYFGRHYFNITNERGEPIYGMGKKRVKINLCKFVVDESVSALFAAAPEIKSYAKSEGAKAAVEDKLKSIWCNNDGKARLKQMAIMGGVTGDCFIKYVYDSEKKSVIPNILDTDWVTPIFADVNNISVLAGIAIEYLMKPARGKPFQYTELITAEKVIIMHDRKVMSDEPHGYDFLPVSHTKNIDLPNSFSGMSDIEQIYGLNDEVNYSISDRANALYYHGDPLLAITGAGAGELKVGANRTLILPDEKAKAEYIKRDVDFSSLGEHIAELRKELLRIARLPEQAPQQGSISGVALAMLQAPLIKLVADKQISYGGGLEQGNEIILKMLAAEGEIGLPDDLRTDIIFAPYLPVDEKLEGEVEKGRVDYYSALVNNGFISKETAMEQMISEGLLQVANVAAEVEKIAKEKEDEAQGAFPDGFKDKGGAGQSDNGAGGEINLRK